MGTEKEVVYLRLREFKYGTIYSFAIQLIFIKYSRRRVSSEM
jgi:hypothetical protein